MQSPCKVDAVKDFSKRFHLMEITIILFVFPLQDTRILIERYKSGDVPPCDFKFEDMSDPRAMLDKEPLEKASNLNLYQRKREIEAEIKVTVLFIQQILTTVELFIRTQLSRSLYLHDDPSVE